MSSKQFWAKKYGATNRIKKMFPQLQEGESGIYFFTRVDENGIKYAYVGQAKDLLSRLASHLIGYQHIDISYRKRKAFNEKKNPYGWDICYVKVAENNLDAQEKYYIADCINNNYQLYNKTIGGQGEGKSGIAENKPTKGYHQGLEQGYKNALRDIREYFNKYLDYSIKEPRLTKHGSIIAIKEKKFNDFKELLEEENEH